MKRENLKKIGAVLLSILITASIYTATLAIYMYAKGWRVDIFDQSLKKVGVLTVEPSPTQSNVYINDELIGRGNRSTTLDIGEYDVRVTREGYFDWTKNISIIEEKSTHIFPFLIKAELEPEIIFRSNNSLEGHWIDQDNNYLLLLTKNNSSYQILRYRINTGFWDFGANPTIVLEIEESEANEITDIDLILSPSGELALLEIERNNKTSNKYILSTNRLTNYADIIREPLRLQDFRDYSITWDSSDQYLILESDNDVISYDITKSTKHLLMRKLNPLDVWSTDNQGFFYIFKHIDTSEDEVLEYSVLQYRLDGSTKLEVLPTVYFQNNTEFINKYRSGDFDFTYFTNSPECTQSIGKVESFTVNRDSRGLYIVTTKATYWYDMNRKKYLTVLPYPTEIVEFSPDGEKVLIKGVEGYKVFTFDKQSGDHTIDIGTKRINNINNKNLNTIKWLENSRYFRLQEGEQIYIIDIDGDNKVPLIRTQNIAFWTINNSIDKLITLDTGQNGGLGIVIYTIH